jgi:hypothetical protein
MSLDGMAPASVDTSAKKTRRWLLHRLKESLAESRPSPKAAKNRSIKVFYPRSIVDTHYIPARLQSKWEPRHCVKTGPYDDLTMRDRMPPASVASCQIASFFLPQAVPPKIRSWRRRRFCTSGCKNPRDRGFLVNINTF